MATRNGGAGGGSGSFWEGVGDVFRENRDRIVEAGGEIAEEVGGPVDDVYGDLFGPGSGRDGSPFPTPSGTPGSGGFDPPSTGGPNDDAPENDPPSNGSSGPGPLQNLSAWVQQNPLLAAGAAYLAYLAYQNT
jgi:hypothetical protein